MSDVPSSKDTDVDPLLQLIQSKHTMPTNFNSSPFHVPVVRTSLTRAFPGRFASVTDEIRASCTDWFNVGDGKSTS